MVSVVHRYWEEVERLTVKEFESCGFRALRSRQSGGGSRSRSLPDVLAGDGRHYFGVEVKSTAKSIVYIKRSQIDGLLNFCDGFGATPLVCVKFGRFPISVYPLQALGVTDKYYLVHTGLKSMSVPQFLESHGGGGLCD